MTVGSARDDLLSVLMVDPGLFSPPYDAALTRGLQANGVEVAWATRASRPGETCELSPSLTHCVYYRGTEQTARFRRSARLRKGLSHVRSSLDFLKLCARLQPDLVHFQWATLPIVDRWVIHRLQRRSPVVLTVHGLIPFNGNPTSRLQAIGYPSLLRSVDRLIVHTHSGREALSKLSDRIEVIPHGPLKISGAANCRGARSGNKWTYTLFGKLRAYKGLDVLIDAVGLLKPQDRGRLRVVVAGEAMMDLAPLLRRIEQDHLHDTIDMRVGWLSEAGMQNLFAETDAFVFPYREIEASGVYHLVRGLDKWIVASALGDFSESLDPSNGTLVPPGNPQRLADALLDGIGAQPTAPARHSDWIDIGQMLRNVYEDVLRGRARSGGAP